jgi:4'-phosphopantetheinyl transferase EntD
MIEALLPAGVAWAERFDDDVPEALFPAEETAVARAVPTRRREFATGRWCARRALADLGVDAAAIPSGASREPVWPAGVAGALTHCAGYRAAIVAHVAAYASVGLDAEPDAPVPPGVLATVSLPAERDQLAALPAGVAWDRLLFSAKESVYKAWFPLARRWLGFTDCRLDLRPDGTFTARLLVDGPVPGFTGRWLAERGLLATAVFVPSGSGAQRAVR